MSLLPFIVSGIGLGAIYALSSVGLVILYRASGTLNFAFGAFGGISAFLAWQLVQNDVPEPIGWIVGIAVSTAIAYGYGRYLRRVWRIAIGWCAPLPRSVWRSFCSAA